MIRARFKANLDDYRPVVWPINHPYWCTGFDDEYSIIVAYADDVDEIKRNWPEAMDIDFKNVADYFFSDRFPIPEWFSHKKTENFPAPDNK